ncbi:hypothetical protein C1A50_0313 [Paenibacillus polymyxa]|nr:hypothetical protein C1A50_0313 [Paenibacillus polymyxa]
MCYCIWIINHISIQNVVVLHASSKGRSRKIAIPLLPIPDFAYASFDL